MLPYCFAYSSYRSIYVIKAFEEFCPKIYIRKINKKMNVIVCSKYVIEQVRAIIIFLIPNWDHNTQT